MTRSITSTGSASTPGRCPTISRFEMFHRALTEMTNVYQPSTDGKKTIRAAARASG